MTDRQREKLGVLAGCAVLLLVLLLSQDDVGSTSKRFLSAPGSRTPAPNPSPEDEGSFQPLHLSFDSGWVPTLKSAGANVAAAVADPIPRLNPPDHVVKASRRSLFSWIKKRKPGLPGTTELERAPDPPAPDSLKRSSRGLQLGLKF